MNFLMLDERTVVVEAAEAPIATLMRSLGCEVTRVRSIAFMRSVAAFTAARQIFGATASCSLTFRRSTKQRKIARADAGHASLRLAARMLPDDVEELRTVLRQLRFADTVHRSHVGRRS